MTEKKPISLRLSPDFYENEHGPSGQTKLTSTITDFVFSRVEIHPIYGILVHLKGCKFPRKGLPNLKDTMATDQVKRFLSSILMGISGKEMAPPAIAFMVLPWFMKKQAINRFLERFCVFAYDTLGSSLLKEQYLCPVAKEAYSFISKFLLQLGINEGVSYRMGRIFSMFLQNDDAYRYRLQDVLSEFSYSDFYFYPRRSIKKAIQILISREQQSGAQKFEAFGKIIRFALLFPRFKKAFKKAIQKIDIQKFQFDEADRYHVMVKEGYDFFGKSIDDRVDEWIVIHSGVENVPPVTTLTL